MKKFLFLATVLLMNVEAMAQVGTVNLKTSESLEVNCENSLPVLVGKVVSCEVICKIQVIETYHEIEACDQTCWKERELFQTDVVVTRFPQNDILFHNINLEGGSNEKALASAKNIANLACTKIEYIH